MRFPVTVSFMFTLKIGLQFAIYMIQHGVFCTMSLHAVLPSLYERDCVAECVEEAALSPGVIKEALVMRGVM